MTTPCITYSLPYEHGRQITLCADCAATHGTLGEVQHGEHEDECEGCDCDTQQARDDEDRR